MYDWRDLRAYSSLQAPKEMNAIFVLYIRAAGAVTCKAIHSDRAVTCTHDHDENSIRVPSYHEIHTCDQGHAAT